MPDTLPESPEPKWSEGYGFLYVACFAAVYGLADPWVFKLFGVLAALLILNEAIRNILVRSLQREATALRRAMEDRSHAD